MSMYVCMYVCMCACMVTHDGAMPMVVVVVSDDGAGEISFILQCVVAIV